jgi:hypothetical protein
MIKQLGVIFSILLAFIIFINPAFAIEPLDRVDITNPRLVNSFGSQISNQINVNQQIQITADVKNNQDKTQTFVYIIHTAEIYVWDVSEEGSTKSWQRLDALAEQVSLKITS